MLAACVSACEHRYTTCENTTDLSCTEICEGWKGGEPAGCYSTGTAYMSCLSTQAPDCAGSDWGDGQTTCDDLDYAICVQNVGADCARHELWDIQCNAETFAHRCRPTTAVPTGCTAQEMLQDDTQVFCCTSEL